MWRMKTAMNITEVLYDEDFINDQAIQVINKEYVALDSDLGESLFKIIKNRFIPCMRYVDENFFETFHEIEFGGSYCKALKVDYSGEYDLNLIIELPIDYQELQFQSEWYGSTNYVKIRSNYLYKKGSFSSTLMDGYYLDQREFYDWIDDVLLRASGRYGQRYGGNQFSVSYKGDLSISIFSTQANEKIIFNFIPCLKFSNSDIQGLQRYLEYNWIAMAKPLRQEVYKANTLWMTSFYNDEIMLLYNQNKSVIRLVKAFIRLPMLDLTNIKGYFIETLFLHELDNDEFRTMYKNASQTRVFNYMIRRLLEVLENGWLSFYWNVNNNLFENINTTDAANTLREIICDIYDQIRDDPQVLLSYFEEEIYDSDEDFDDDDSYEDSDEDYY